jgi:uncharacterized protein (DUF1800 family)
MKKRVIILFFLLLYSSVTTANETVSTDDIRWLNRLTYGVNTATLNAYQAQGREQFLQTQLKPNSQAELPTEINKVIIQTLENDDTVKSKVRAFLHKKNRIKLLAITDKAEAKKEKKKQLIQQLSKQAERHLLRALYSPAQLREQMVWFWLNHFSISNHKNPLINLALADYEEQAIRPHALGSFRDLLLATLRHPAMIMYLDNAKNAANKINENYARELLELHTLGVDGGYSQQDIQELSRILTGVGVNWTDKKPELSTELKPYYLSAENGFEFSPARHDFGKKVFLGKSIEGQGFAEIEQVLDILVKHPATARFISRKLATYFVSDTPSVQLIEQTAKSFQDSQGDIAKTLHTLLTSAEFNASLGKKASDPLHYVLATVRFVYDGQTPTNMQPINSWLTTLGQPMYGHLTPDGYGLAEKDWLSQGQLLKRFQLANTMTRYNPKLFEGQNEDFSLSALLEVFAETPTKKITLPKLENPLFHQAIEPLLSKQTKAALNKATNNQEWNSLLLSAPEFFYR